MTFGDQVKCGAFAFLLENRPAGSVEIKQNFAPGWIAHPTAYPTDGSEALAVGDGFDAVQGRSGIDNGTPGTEFVGAIAITQLGHQFPPFVSVGVA